MARKSFKTKKVNGPALMSLIDGRGTWASALADKARVSESLIRKMMAGGTCDIDMIKRVAEALKVGIEELLVLLRYVS